MSDGWSGAAVPRLARGTRLRQDPARGGWVLLGPERVLQPDPIALEILKRVDGHASLEEIVAGLAADFSGDPERIEADVRSFLGGLAEKGLVEVA